jgi:hypothetical protein
VIGRRRNAPRAGSQSDVTRFRGVLIASIAGAVVTAALALSLSDSATRRGSPGPLQRPHQLAKLACASCHNAKPLAAACTGCHGAHDSSRPAHARLAAAGELACASCHAGHGSGAGITFLPDGRAIRYRGGRERAVTAGLYRPEAPVTVPLVPAAACARCHDLASPRDPVAACLLSGGGPSVCFDEHRVPGDEAVARSAAWEAAREIAATTSAPPDSAGQRGGPWLWLGLGALVSGAVLGGTRLRRRRPARSGRPRSCACRPSTPPPASAAAPASTPARTTSSSSSATSRWSRGRPTAAASPCASRSARTDRW